VVPAASAWRPRWAWPGWEHASRSSDATAGESTTQYRRLQATSVTANALHPGLVSTGFGGEDPGRAQRLLVPLLRPFMKSPAQGAATSIQLASDPELERVTGRYFAKSESKPSSKRSYDETTAARLWQVSADLVGLTTAATTP
jgi:retinol dehydrogenase-14